MEKMRELLNEMRKYLSEPTKFIRIRNKELSAVAKAIAEQKRKLEESGQYTPTSEEEKEIEAALKYRHLD